MAEKHWIQAAISHPGALTASAKREGESPMEYAHEHMHDSGKTGARSRLAITLSQMRRKHAISKKLGG